MSNLSNEQVIGLREALDDGSTVMVAFEKANGDIREMICVSNPEISGDDYEFKDNGNGSSVNEDPDNQLVWEPAIKQWRKFKYSRVQNWAIAN